MDSITVNVTEAVEEVALTLDEGGPGGGGSDVATQTTAADAKTTPVDADLVPLVDSAAANVLKKLSWANLNATLKTYFDALYSAVGHNHTGVYDPAGSAAAAQATAVQRTNHTGTQAQSTVVGLEAALAARVLTADLQSVGTDNGDAPMKYNSGGGVTLDNLTLVNGSFYESGASWTYDGSAAAAHRAALGAAASGANTDITSLVACTAVTSGTTLALSANYIHSDCRIEPVAETTNSACQLGSSTKRWNRVYCKSIWTNGNNLTIETSGGDTFFTATTASTSPSTGAVVVGNGTSGGLGVGGRVVAGGAIRPGSYTVAAANALSTPLEGSIIYVSNQSGGGKPAYYRGGWLLIKDDSAITT
ncbi:hypothetical protein [Luteolibacter marinus]|uniref:hypothetical protein n=1 Tax=Luteolibacter marinus TaxID=2776705 RepID=UPI001868157A|nr:hypothetical protein [Luteolibacter marinus]